MIYHITTQADWQQAGITGEYHAASLETQGFIHFSQREQIIRVANVVYHNQQGLVILCVDESKLTAPLKQEPPDPGIPAHHYTGELFPHLYGALNTDAVIEVVEFPPTATGEFELPEQI